MAHGEALTAFESGKGVKVEGLEHREDLDENLDEATV